MMCTLFVNNTSMTKTNVHTAISGAIKWLPYMYSSAKNHDNTMDVMTPNITIEDIIALHINSSNSFKRHYCLCQAP